jgi:hypothetical protein
MSSVVSVKRSLLASNARSTSNSLMNPGMGGQEFECRDHPIFVGVKIRVVVPTVRIHSAGTSDSTHVVTVFACFNIPRSFQCAMSDGG